MSIEKPTKTDLDQLVEENRQLARQNKKLQRLLDRQEEFIRRNKITNESKKVLSSIIEQERSRIELSMNLLLANIRDFILFFDTAGRLQYCSESFLQATNVSVVSQIASKRMSEIFADLIPQKNIDQIVEMGRNFFKGSPIRNMEMQMQVDLEKNGVLRDYLAEVNILINDDGDSEGFVMLFYDTSELMDARREAEKANAAKSDFLATISHEIRTPMNAVIGLTGMIEETSLNERQLDLVNRIRASSTNLLDIINDLLDFSKIEAGKLEIIDDYFDLHELLNGIKSLFTLMMSQKDLEFVCNFANDLPEVVYSDGKRVRQIMVNLLNNAYKYTPKGSVTFDVSVASEGVLRFSIQDTGIGIKEDESHKLFQEFEQLDQVRNKHVTGTGLGLAITKRICDIMGGTIEVQSVYGKGSDFIVVLPLKSGRRVDLPHAEITAPEFTASKAKVLIVDDVEVNVEITSFMLEQFEVQTAAAFDGRQAVDMVEREHFDLVLMDHMMPIMDGVEATQIIRQREQEQAEKTGQPVAHLPIVALTANAISGVEEMFKSEGFDGFISKPVAINDMAWSLYELLPKDLID